jgi:hypothetical protein
MEHIVSVHDLFRAVVSTNGSLLTPKRLDIESRISFSDFESRNRTALSNWGLVEMLTRKQYELLRFISERLKESGVPPSFDEMKDARSPASTASSPRWKNAASFVGCPTAPAPSR